MNCWRIILSLLLVCTVCSSATAQDKSDAIFVKKTHRLLLGDSKGGSIKKSELLPLSADIVTVLRNGTTLKVMGFRLTYGHYREDLKTYRSKNDRLTEPMISKIRGAGPKDMFYIDDVVVENPDGLLTELDNVVVSWRILEE